MTFEKVPPPKTKYRKRKESSENLVRDLLRPKDGPYDDPAPPKATEVISKREHPIFESVRQFRKEILHRILPPRK